MDNQTKSRLESAMASWKAKGNTRLAEACAIALEEVELKNQNKDARQRRNG